MTDTRGERILVVGPGAMGLRMAGELLRAGLSVEILDHRPRRAGRLARGGFEVIEGRRRRLYRPIVRRRLPRDFRADVIIVAVKAQDTRAALKSLPKGLLARATVLSLQNGLGIFPIMLEYVPASRALRGITSLGATLAAERVVRAVGRGETLVGGISREARRRACRVARLLRGCGLRARAMSIERRIWEKLFVNVAINPLTAILRVENGRLLAIPSARERMRRAAAEAVAVARAEGFAFDPGRVWEAIERVARATARNRSSMLQDVEAGRVTEIEFLNGAVVRLGRRHGVGTPENESLVREIL